MKTVPSMWAISIRPLNSNIRNRPKFTMYTGPEYIIRGMDFFRRLIRGMDFFFRRLIRGVDFFHSAHTGTHIRNIDFFSMFYTGHGLLDNFPNFFAKSFSMPPAKLIDFCSK